MIFTLLIVLAVSIDSFCIGVAYGMKNVKIPIKSLLLINLCCVVTFTIASLFGKLLSLFIDIRIAAILSTTILIILGICFLIQVYINDIYSRCKTPLLKKIRIKSLGIVIDILKEPITADMNVSGDIDAKEAIYLGFALSLDSLAVGLGSSLSGMINLYAAILILTFLNLVLIIFGLYLGKQCIRNINSDKIKYIPSLILISLGVAGLI